VNPIQELTLAYLVKDLKKWHLDHIKQPVPAKCEALILTMAWRSRKPEEGWE